MDPNQYPRQPPHNPAAPVHELSGAPPPFPYDPATSGGHFGAASQVASSGYVPATASYNSTFANVTSGLQGQYRHILATYWQHVIHEIETEEHDFKVHQLPLARIKKVMKSDEDVKMISAEAPILFAKGCDIFITELTMRAWIHAEESKRRTLQRSDIAQAISKSDMFDFLIDIVPREVAQQHSSMVAPPQQAFDYKRGADDTGPPGASPSGGAPGAFPLGYQDHAQGGANYQTGPLGYTATPPGTSAGQGGQAYPHHPGHPLYDGNRYENMYYGGQQAIHNLSYPPHEQHPPPQDPAHQQHEYNGPPGQPGYAAGDDVSHYYGSGGAR